MQAGLEESELSSMRLNLMEKALPSDLLSRMSTAQPAPKHMSINPLKFMRRSSMKASSNLHPQRQSAPPGALLLTLQRMHDL